MKHTIHKLSLLLSIIVLLCSCELREDEDQILIGIGMIILLKKYLTRIGKKQFV